MHQPWIDYSGLLVDKRFRLAELINEEGPKAAFRTEDGLMVRCLDMKSPGASRQLESWRRGVGLDHPNLLAVHAAGTLQSNGDEIAYAVMNRTDDSLASVLPERALYPAEAQEVLEATLRALTFLHGRTLAHSAVSPSNIVAVGKHIQLTCDNLQPGSQHAAQEDVKAVGATLVEIMTQDRNAGPDRIPPPYRAVARGCLEKGWTAQQALAALEGRTPIPETIPFKPVRPESEETEKNTARMVPILVAAVLLVLVAGAFFIWRGRSQPTVASDVTPPPVTNTVPAETKTQAAAAVPEEPPRPSPVRVEKEQSSTRARAAAPAPKERPAIPRTAPERSAAAVPADATSEWAVVTAIYRNYEAAEKRADAVREKAPALDVKVFPNQGQGQKYMVLVGSGLSQQEANRVRAKALSNGLPRDTYVTKLRQQ